MTRLAILAALFAAPAFAQEVTLTEGEQPFAIIRLHNMETFLRPGSRDEVVTLATSRGPVTYRHIRTGNDGNGCCPDSIEIMDWPDGLIAVPGGVTVEEGEAGEIRLLIWDGM